MHLNPWAIAILQGCTSAENEQFKI